MGIPIAVKYAGVTAVLLVTFLLFVARSDLRLAVQTADETINNTGIKLAMMFSEEIEPFWARTGRTGAENSEAQESLQAMLGERIAHPAANRDVLDVVVLGADRQTFIAHGRTGRELTLERSRSLETEAATRAGVEVRTGFLSAGGRSQRVRFFERPIDFEDRQVGYVQVFLSADAIDRLNSDLTESVLVNCLIALIIGIPVVLLVGSLLTRPVRTLKRDMEAVAAGDLEHQSTVRSRDELGSLAAAFNGMTRRLAEAREQELRTQALERDLSIATRIQSALLPEKLPEIPGYELAAHYVSAKEVGGDYYDFIKLGDDRYGFVVADVSGKGIPGSLVMTMTRSLVRMAARVHPRVSDLLTRVNSSLTRDMTRGMFVTLIYIDFTPSDGKVRIARAGHNPAYLYQAAQGTIGQLAPSGIALGMDAKVFPDQLQVGEFTLAPGDFLVLYTDGIIEAMDPDANEYTPERFAAVLEAVPEHDAETIVATVVADLADHTMGAEPSDDVTLLVLKRLS